MNESPKHGEQKTEIEIYLKYEQSPEVKKWVALLRSTKDDKTLIKCGAELFELGRAALAETQAEPAPNGQYRFDNALFFDFAMTDQQKLDLLSEDEDQDTRREFLLSRIANAPSELLSVMYQI